MSPPAPRRGPRRPEATAGSAERPGAISSDSRPGADEVGRHAGASRGQELDRGLRQRLFQSRWNRELTTVALLAGTLPYFASPMTDYNHGAGTWPPSPIPPSRTYRFTYTSRTTTWPRPDRHDTE